MTNQQNTNTEPLNGKKPDRNWNGWDMFFIIAPIVSIILVPLGGLLYLGGMLNDGFFCIIGFTGIIFFIICCFFINIIRLLIGLKKHVWKKEILIVTEIGISIFFMVLLIRLPFGSNVKENRFYPIRMFTCGIRDRIKIKIDIDEIRSWLRTLDKEGLSKYPQNITYEKLPKSLKVLRAKTAHLSIDENGNPMVRLIWGTGVLRTWGIVIGMKDMDIPPSDFSQYGEYRLAMEPGVYVWRELR